MICSIIIPSYNSAEDLRICLDSLVEQDSDKDYEILIVDNNSTDDTGKIIEEFENKYPDIVKGLEENEIQGSYAARNKGIKHAKGEIVAFVDADCRANNDWLRRGVELIQRDDVDLVGGRIEFSFPKGGTGAELLDSSINMQVEKNVKNDKVAKTANLFVKKSVFDSVGLFSEELKSGGDVEWTGKAVENGFNLVYGKEVVVYHPARDLKELMKKQYRVGKGKSQIENSGFLDTWKSFIKIFIPPRLSTPAELIGNDKVSEYEVSFISLYIAVWLSGSATSWGKFVRGVKN